jgi:tetratricopeptide (TPR) repeat protein
LLQASLKESVAVPSEEPSLEAVWTRAMALHQAGRLELAEPLYRQLASRCPSTAQIWHLLGLAVLQAGRAGEAVPILRQAISCDGRIPDFHNNLGVALSQSGDPETATNAFAMALTLKPDYADALNNLGGLAQRRRDFAAAIACFERVLALQPGHQDAAGNLRRSLLAEARRLEAAGAVGTAIGRYLAALPVPPPLFRNLHDAEPAGTELLQAPAQTGPAPAVSVIIPCFKAAATLPRAIASIRGQGEGAVEIILVDDASPDDTAAAALALARNHPGITVLRRGVNGGCGPARNDGIRIARGRYIAFLDADDEYAPGYLAAGMSLLDRDQALDACRTGIALAGYDAPVEPLHYQALINTVAMNLMLRREVLWAIGGFPEGKVFRGEHGAEDAPVARILARYFRLGWDLRPLMIYHVEGNSHFRRFVEGTRIEDGRLIRRHETADEASGLLPLAILMHERAFLARRDAGF